MALVSLGTALFTVAGLSTPLCDQARIAAAAATGVGFLGAGVITVQEKRTVSGLTTAATIWVAAALGVTAGNGLWLVTGIGTAVSTLVSNGAPKWRRVKRRPTPAEAAPAAEA